MTKIVESAPPSAPAATIAAAAAGADPDAHDRAIARCVEFLCNEMPQWFGHEELVRVCFEHACRTNKLHTVDVFYERCPQFRALLERLAQDMLFLPNIPRILLLAKDDCRICLCDTPNVVTRCNHVYCTDCVRRLFEQRQCAACPTCRANLRRDQLLHFDVHKLVAASAAAEVEQQQHDNHDNHDNHDDQLPAKRQRASSDTSIATSTSHFLSRCASVKLLFTSGVL